MPHVEALKLIIYSSGQSGMGWKGYCLNQKIAAMHWSNPKSYNKRVCLWHSLDFGFRGQWSIYRNSFWQSRLLTMTIWPCSFSFNVQVMILMGSSEFFNCASASEDRCYFYIIIHYGMSGREWGIKSVLRGDRPDPESFKAIDTYTYSENHTSSPYLCPRIH